MKNDANLLFPFLPNLIQDTGFAPSVSFEEGIRKIIKMPVTDF